jgi:hypothetical protein
MIGEHSPTHTYPKCMGVSKTILHCFYECPQAQKNMEMSLYHCQMHANLRTTIQTMEVPFMGAMHL